MKVAHRTADREVAATVTFGEGVSELTIRVWKGRLQFYQGTSLIEIPKNDVDPLLALANELIEEARS